MKKRMMKTILSKNINQKKCSYYATKDIHLLCGNVNSLIQTIKDNSIDLIATDPPYEINFEGNDWDKPHLLNWNRLAKEFQRVLKPDGNLIIFQGWSNVCKTKEILDQYFIMKNWIIYDRVKGRGTKTNLVSTREDILWYVTNENQYTYNKIPSNIKKKTGGMGLRNGQPCRALSNVWTDISPLVPWSKERVAHPTQKPVQLMNRILEVYSCPNDLVLDPFFGSGTTAISSLLLNRKFIGFEYNKKYYHMGKKRIENLSPQKVSKTGTPA